MASFGQVTYQKAPGGSSGGLLLPGDYITITFSNMAFTTDSLYVSSLIRTTSASSSGGSMIFYLPANSSTLMSTPVTTIIQQSVAGNTVTWTGTYACESALTAGPNNFYFYISDRQGQYIRYTLTVTPSNYLAPTVDTITAVRCKQDGTESVFGTYLKVKATWTPAKLDGADIATTAVYLWGPYGGPYGSQIPITAQNTFMPPVGGSISPTTVYAVVVVLTNAIGAPVTRTVDVPTMTPMFYFKKGGHGMGVGMEPTRTDTLEVAWPVLSPGLFFPQDIYVSGGGINLKANSYIRFQNSAGSDVGYVDTNYNNLNMYGTVQSWGVNLTSKEEIKEDISDAPAVLDIINDAELFTYNLKSEDGREQRKRHYGFVIGKGRKTPEAVIADTGEHVDLYSMSSILWKALQELSVKCDDYERRIADLEKRLADANIN